jgi:hypothetical protein
MCGLIEYLSAVKEMMMLTASTTFPLVEWNCPEALLQGLLEVVDGEDGEIVYSPGSVIRAGHCDVDWFESC